MTTEDDMLDLAIEDRMLRSLGLLEPGEPTRFGHALMQRHLVRCQLRHGGRCRYCEEAIQR